MIEISNRLGAQLFNRLATGYHAGLDLKSLWAQEAKSLHPGLARASRMVSEQLSGGSTLAEAMNRTQGFFSPLMVAVIKAGEVSGRLEQSFRRLAQHCEAWHRFRVETLRSLAWPLFELGFSIFLVGLLILIMGWAMSSVNPKGIDFFGWGWGTWDYFRAYSTLVCLGAIGIGLLIAGLQFQWFGSLPSRILRYVPLIGGILRNLSLARLSWAMGAGLGAGMNVIESLKIGVEASQDARLADVESQIRQSITENRSIYETLAKTERFPNEFLTLVSNGELAGELPEALERVSALYQSRVETGVTLLKIATFFATFLFVVVVVGGAVLFMYTQLYMGIIREFDQ
jgi:type IV pilus assembly protein PilC